MVEEHYPGGHSPSGLEAEIWAVFPFSATACKPAGSCCLTFSWEKDCKGNNDLLLLGVIT